MLGLIAEFLELTQSVRDLARCAGMRWQSSTDRGSYSESFCSCLLHACTGNAGPLHWHRRRLPTPK